MAMFWTAVNTQMDSQSRLQRSGPCLIIRKRSVHRLTIKTGTGIQKVADEEGSKHPKENAGKLVHERGDDLEMSRLT